MKVVWSAKTWVVPKAVHWVAVMANLKVDSKDAMWVAMTAAPMGCNWAGYSAES